MDRDQSVEWAKLRWPHLPLHDVDAPRMLLDFLGLIRDKFANPASASQRRRDRMPLSLRLRYYYLAVSPLKIGIAGVGSAG